MRHPALPYDFEVCKVCSSRCRIAYRLTCGSVYACKTCSLHYLDYLDDERIDPSVHESALTVDRVAYIEQQLQSSASRFDNHIACLRKYGELDGKRVLDVGCGGGLFLTKARDLGALVMGIELDDSRVTYCRSKHGLDVVKRPIESEHWDAHNGMFDFVTLWDVIEHVNFPSSTLLAARKLLKPEGLLLLDTPSRDSFYHRFGAATYRLSLGRFPTLLNAMYSNRPFAHKQIFSTQEIAALLNRAGFKTLTVARFHELSFPCEFYLEKVFHSKTVARLCAPLASVAFKLLPVRNKMVAVGQKT